MAQWAEKYFMLLPMILGALMGVAYSGLFGPKTRLRGLVTGGSALLLVGVATLVAIAWFGASAYAGLAAVSLAAYGFIGLLLWGVGLAGGALCARLLHADALP
jgi:hypothetical protein